jgi:hypothetical protein
MTMDALRQQRLQILLLQSKERKGIGNRSSFDYDSCEETARTFAQDD